MLALASFMKVLLDRVPDRKLTVDSLPSPGDTSASITPSSSFSSTASYTHDASVKALKEAVGDVKVFEVFENERRGLFPPHAFGPGNLFIHPHFSDFTGKIKVDVPNANLTALKPPSGCEWVGDWKVCREHTQTDSHGWSYAISYDFLVSNCRQNKSIARSSGRASRRRRHVRTYRKIPKDSNTPSAAAASLASPRNSNNAPAGFGRSSSESESAASAIPPPPSTSPSTAAASKKRGIYSLDEIAIGSMSVDVHRLGTTPLPPPSGELDDAAPFDLKYAAEVILLCRNGKLIPTEVMSRLIGECTELVRALPNFVHQSIPHGNEHEHKRSRVIVVGDIHGNLTDLLHILDTYGMPSHTNRYVFNGDFVDRGDCGVEVMCILLSLYRACPEYVTLNRGNHEDRVINSVYGFQQECTTKFDEDIFNKMGTLFDCMPLFVMVEKLVFIVHGGLFIDRTVSFEDLDKINRFDYECQAEVPYPQCLEMLDTAEEQWDAFGKELHRNAMWSDPRFEPGLEISHRGSGVLFGPDVAEEFMRNNNVKMIIRSHEVCKKGFYLPFGRTTNPALYNPSLPLLATIFSASNYSNSGNDAAVLVLMKRDHEDSHTVHGTHLHFSVHRFKTSQADLATLEQSNRSSLSEMILKKKATLLAEFEVLDAEKLGVVSRSHWAEVMQRVTNVKIRWLALLPTLVPEDCFTSSAVLYQRFLDHFSVQKASTAALRSPEAEGKLDIDALYGQRRRLEVIFNFFDVNGDGVSMRHMRMFLIFAVILSRCFVALQSGDHKGRILWRLQHFERALTRGSKADRSRAYSARSGF
jgi:serine/threonine-protein phosphatase with EF-hand domain